MPSPMATKTLIDTYVPRVSSYANPTDFDTITSASNYPASVRRVRVVLPNDQSLIESGDNAAKAGGLEILSMPAGLIIPLGAKIVTGTIVGTQTDANNTAGEVGIGTAVGSGANATLGAVGATAENFMEGATIGNMTAGAAVSLANLNDGPRDPIGNASAAWSLYLNLATTFGNYTNPQTINAQAGFTVDLFYIPLE